MLHPPQGRGEAGNEPAWRSRGGACPANPQQLEASLVSSLLPSGSLSYHLDLLYLVPFFLAPIRPMLPCSKLLPERSFGALLRTPNTPHPKATRTPLRVWEGSWVKSRAAPPPQGYLQLKRERQRAPMSLQVNTSTQVRYLNPRGTLQNTDFGFPLLI